MKYNSMPDNDTGQGKFRRRSIVAPGKLRMLEWWKLLAQNMCVARVASRLILRDTNIFWANAN